MKGGEQKRDIPLLKKKAFQAHPRILHIPNTIHNFYFLTSTQNYIPQIIFLLWYAKKGLQEKAYYEYRNKQKPE